MKHRVFIAINLPDEIKNELASCEDKWPELPCRWTKKDNLHITLEFLGYVQDGEILDICKIVKETTLKHEPFEIKLTKILYGPPRKMPPRMIWAEGEKSKELNELQNDLRKALGAPSEERSFSLHITLGRLKTWQWKQIEPEERPNIEEDINLSFEVDSIEVMESTLSRGGPKYAILKSFPLQN